MQKRDRVQSVYAARNNAELESRYDDWAGEYDRDLGADPVWTSPSAAVALLAKYVRTNAKILDAGAGTGLVGERLRAAGYRNLHAIDLSLGMLAVARNKDIYRELQQMTLGEALAFADDAFDAVIAVGVFTTGHAPARAFNELVRITRPGGTVVFSLRTDQVEQSFGPTFAELASADKWQLAECSAPYRPLPEDEPDVIHRIWVYRVTG